MNPLTFVQQAQSCDNIRKPTVISSPERINIVYPISIASMLIESYSSTCLLDGGTARRAKQIFEPCDDTSVCSMSISWLEKHANWREIHFTLTACSKRNASTIPDGVDRDHHHETKTEHEQCKETFDHVFECHLSKLLITIADGRWTKEMKETFDARPHVGQGQFHRFCRGRAPRNDVYIE